MPLTKRCDILKDIVGKYTSFLVTFNEHNYSIQLMELLLHYRLYDEFYTFIDQCISGVLLFTDNIMRMDNAYTDIFNRFTEICLYEDFDKYKGNHIMANLFLISANAPKEFREVCHKLFMKAEANQKYLGYRAVCTMVVFRYYLSRIVANNIENRGIINECKKIQMECNFNAEEVEFPIEQISCEVMSIINILTSKDLGRSLDFSLSPKAIEEYFESLISILKTHFDEINSNPLYNLIKLDGSKIVRHPTPRSLTNSSSGHSIINKNNSGSKISTFSKTKSIDEKENKNGGTPRSQRLSREITKRMLHNAGIFEYDEIIDDKELYHCVFLKMDRKELKKLGITDKTHQDKILEVTKQYNKTLPDSVEGLKKARGLLMTSLPTGRLQSQGSGDEFF